MDTAATFEGTVVPGLVGSAINAKKSISMRFTCSAQLHLTHVCLREKTLGEDQPYMCRPMHHLAKVVFATGKHEEAIGSERHSLGGLEGFWVGN